MVKFLSYARILATPNLADNNWLRNVIYNSIEANSIIAFSALERNVLRRFDESDYQ